MHTYTKSAVLWVLQLRRTITETATKFIPNHYLVKHIYTYALNYIAPTDCL